MGENLINGLITVATALIGVAIIAVLVSRNANTAGVLQAAGSAFSSDLSAAVSPVTGATMSNFGFTGGSPVNSPYA